MGVGIRGYTDVCRKVLPITPLDSGGKQPGRGNPGGVAWPGGLRGGLFGGGPGGRGGFKSVVRNNTFFSGYKIHLGEKMGGGRGGILIYRGGQKRVFFRVSGGSGRGEKRLFRAVQG